MSLFSRKPGATDAGAVEASAAARQVPFEIWGDGWPNTEVVGESHHGPAIRALFGRHYDPSGTETRVLVRVEHETKNGYDRNACAVIADSGLVGYLAREDAARYAPAFDALAARGLVAVTSARVYGYDAPDWESNKSKFVGSVTIDLPGPHLLAPSNPGPSGAFVLLPRGGAIQVSGEEEHMDALRPHLCPAGDAWVYATLHPHEDPGARSVKRLVEVRIDGQTVGRFSPKLSGDVLPAVEFLTGKGLTTAVRARVKGNQLKAEVVVYAPRAHELTQDWFATIPAVAEEPGGGLRTAESGPTESLDVGSPTDAHALTPEAAAAAPPMPPAGWYADPHGQHRVRYWDGQQWTEHVSD